MKTLSEEKIVAIKESTFVVDKNSYEGYEIHTDKQVIKLGINLEQCCCESPGYFMSEDNLSEFVGSSLKEIHSTDTNLNSHNFETGFDEEEGGIMFVNLETSNGTLQFTAYNKQNGWYGHSAIVVSEQLNFETIL